MTSLNCYTLRGAVAVLAIAIIGCGPDGPIGKVTPVEGVIKLDDTPLVEVTIQFTPVEGGGKLIGSTGVTDAQGHFVMKTGDGRDGAIVGKQKVTVRSERADTRSGYKGSPRSVPPRYSATDDKNPLGTIDVSEGKKTYDFDLKSK
ncbi:hypothetical protein KIH39_19675 [Telmatocola sphagniphila]|uniref:Carboxypeptidase regulatory-like domain-containing protein n=1 Tax=Telmatocola sphagniphila TaxID=1123043 RepID=A0A8E6B389_9BACT|nr:hypothetical protein [Telmatocola sphagniphila]QVL31047.1 hypothetical protein KIH39_19675 [Telmatocola sphagniphila]